MLRWPARQKAPSVFSPSDQKVLEVSRAVMEKHAKTFRLASALFDEGVRDEVAVLYAFCRLVDDTVDEAPTPEEAHQGTRALREELEGQREPRPLVKAFVMVCEKRSIPLEAAFELMTGVESDLGTVLLPNDRALIRYGYRVAGVVGLTMCGVIGVEDPAAHAFAIDLGIAMQITNICRDVLEDAGRGRVYLPEDRLRAAGTSQEEILNGSASPEAVRSVVRDLLWLAERYYASANDGMHFIPQRPRLAIAAASRMYRAIGLKILNWESDTMRGRTIVSGRKKAEWFGRAVVWSPLARLSAGRPHDKGLHVHLDGLPGANV